MPVCCLCVRHVNILPCSCNSTCVATNPSSIIENIAYTGADHTPWQSQWSRGGNHPVNWIFVFASVPRKSLKMSTRFIIVYPAESIMIVKCSDSEMRFADLSYKENTIFFNWFLGVFSLLRYLSIFLCLITRKVSFYPRSRSLFILMSVENKFLKTLVLSLILEIHADCTRYLRDMFMRNDFAEWLTRLFQSKDVDGRWPKRKRSRSKKTVGISGGENDIKIGIEIFNSISGENLWESLKIRLTMLKEANRHDVASRLDTQNNDKHVRYINHLHII